MCGGIIPLAHLGQSWLTPIVPALLLITLKRCTSLDDKWFGHLRDVLKPVCWMCSPPAIFYKWLSNSMQNLPPETSKILVEMGFGNKHGSHLHVADTGSCGEWVWGAGSASGMGDENPPIRPTFVLDLVFSISQPHVLSQPILWYHCKIDST